MTVTGLSLLTAPLSLPAVVQAAKAKKSSVSAAKKLPGAPAWTRGSQTYLRAGYSTDTPVVAKVAQGTKVFVWGKYNGWYRVETSDHKFAWVHNDFLNCPKADKIAYLKPSKARIASARSAKQRLYGDASEVRAHRAKYGIQSSKPKIAKATPKAKAAPKVKIASKVKVAPKIAARPIIVTPKSRVVASAPRVVTPTVVMPKVASAQPKTPSVVSVNQVRWERGEVALAPSRPSRTSPSHTAQSASGERPAFATERKEGALAMTRAAALPPVVVPNMPAPNAPISVTRVDSTPVVRAPVATTATPVKAAPVKKVVKAPIKKAPVKTAAKPAPKAVAAKASAPKLTASQIRAQKRQAALNARRNNLRARLGTPRMTPPPVAAKGVRPISPSELLRAREEFLAKQRTSDSTAQASNSESTGRIEPMSMAAPDATPTTPFLQRSTFSFQTPQYQDVIHEVVTETSSEVSVESLAPLASTDDLNAVQWMALAKKAAKKAVAPSRGGSPRDFANGRTANGGKQQLGEAFANQALTYRGTPYRYGASSPGRGFDCSGLIYYTLRQRGYNPPRTAAGLASYGKMVKRNELKSGDIVLFSNTYKRGISHVGIYIGNNNFVHAPNTGSRVRIDSLGSSYYSKKYHSARRAG